MCPGNAPDCTDFNLDFKIFRGTMPPDPPREAIFYIFLFNLVEKDAKSHEIFIEQNWLRGQAQWGADLCYVYYCCDRTSQARLLNLCV